MSKAKLLEDLQRSGLTATDQKKLGFTLLKKEQTKSLVGASKISYKIPYYSPDGKETDFFRIRFLQKTTTFGKKKARRYSQPKNKIPRIYFPRLIEWQDIAKDTSQALYITEGEKKAAKACKEGLPTIGLGGVWNWKSKKHNLAIIPDFDLINWQEREVNLVFDSDLKTNPKVHQALVALCEALTKLGAYPYVLYLPDDDEKKIGLDDYLLDHTIDELVDLPSDEYHEARELWRMNSDFAICQHPVSIINLSNDELVDSNNFKSVLCANRIFTRVIETEKGHKLKEFSAPLEWLKWQHRREYTGITYIPGEAEITSDGKYNLWKPIDIQPRKPRKNELDPYFKVRDHLFANELEYVPWFEQWSAYPLLNPGTKLFSAVMMQGVRHGTGKSLLGFTIGKLYGNNFRRVEHKQIYSDFNQWSKNIQFVLGDEISGTDKRSEADAVKNLITRLEIEINTKGVPQYYVPDFVNYYLTSNHPDALYLEVDDRRILVVTVDNGPLDDKVYTKYDEWLQSEDGIEALLWYYQNKVNLTGFNPKGHAPKTCSKDNMISLSMSSVDQFVWSLRNAPNQVLQINGTAIDGDLWTSSDLLKLYDSSATKGKEISLGKALSKAGFRQYHLSNHGLRVYVIRNFEKWSKADYSERVNHYLSTRDVKVVMSSVDGSSSKKKKKF